MMGTPGKFISWIKGPKSDFILFAVFLVLLNIAGSNAFLRLDLTSRHSYSLSKASRETIRSIEDPLSVKVFFSANLPAPYNSVERYLRDLLVEYSGQGSKNFTCKFFNMDKSDSQELARSFGINMIQIQEVKDNEVGLKNAYMGLVIGYADGIEVLDNLTSSDGLEYRLTTTISKMVTTVNALSGLGEKVKLTAYASKELGAFSIQGFGTLEETVKAAYEKVNRKSMDKIEFDFVEPSPSDVSGLASRYGLQTVNWSADKNGQGSGSGVLGIVLEYQDRSLVVPLELARGLFGGYGIKGLDTLEDDLSTSLQALLSKSLSIGYVTGHGEKNLKDAKTGAARLESLVAGMYEFREIPTATEDIPSGITSLVINGPTTELTESELYKIDQFLMRGGNVLLLVDPFEEILPEGEMAYYGGQPTYRPITTGLERLLSKYGVFPAKSYALDKACYTARQQGAGDIPLYYVPLLGKESLNKKESVSRNLAYVLFLMAGPLDISADAEKTPGRKIVPLATTSPEAWRLSENISLMPYAMQAPAKDAMKKENLAVLLEGKFESAFDSAPVPLASAASTDGASTDESAIKSDKHLAKSLQNGKLIVVGSSSITTQSVLDENGQQPVAIFLRNAIDYLNGNGDLIEMRTKGLALNTLDKASPAARTAARAVNMYGLPALAAALGLLAWRRRVHRRKKIEERYREAK